MCEYLLDLWNQCFISYQNRLNFLQSLQMREAKSIYAALENETCKLAEFKNESQHIYKLIRKKENSFGNLFT